MDQLLKTQTTVQSVDRLTQVMRWMVASLVCVCFIRCWSILNNHSNAFLFQEIPATGIDKWFKLEGRSSKSRVDGDCHLKITLTTGKVSYAILLLFKRFACDMLERT